MRNEFDERSDRGRVPREWSRVAVCVFVSFVAFLAPEAVAAGHFERPGSLPADRFLPGAQMSGEGWTVEPTAINDGLTNTYTIASRFGTWEVRGSSRVAMRIREVVALAELEEVSKSKVFVDAVMASATEPLQLAADVVAHPIETAKGIPGGVTRWFKKTTFQVKEIYHDVNEVTEGDEGEEASSDSTLTERTKDEASKQALGYLRISGAEQRWYAQLGVDPYTDNEPLRTAVSAVAKVEGLTSFGMKFVMPDIPGMGEVQGVMNAVWETDPWELRLQNRNTLLDAGLSEETARAFEDQPFLTLTLQTSFLQALRDLEGVEGREHLLARAIDCASREEGERLVVTTALLVRVHRHEGGLTEILAGSRLPVARASDGRLVSVLIADSVFWTEPIAGAAREFAEIWADEDASSRKLLVTRESSKSFRNSLEELGWEVSDQWLATRTETEESEADR